MGEGKFLKDVCLPLYVPRLISLFNDFSWTLIKESGLKKTRIWCEFYKLETGSGFNDLKKNPDQRSWKKDPVSRKGERKKKSFGTGRFLTFSSWGSWPFKLALKPWNPPPKQSNKNNLCNNFFKTVFYCKRKNMEQFYYCYEL